MKGGCYHYMGVWAPYCITYIHNIGVYQNRLFPSPSSATCACLCCTHLAGCRESSSVDPGLLPPLTGFKVLPTPKANRHLTHSYTPVQNYAAMKMEMQEVGGTMNSRGHCCCCLISCTPLAQRAHHRGLQLRQQPIEVTILLTVVTR